MIVVDDQARRCPVCEALVGAMEIEEQTDPLHALDVMQANARHLLVCDLMLPRMDGITLIAQARKLVRSMVGIVLTRTTAESGRAAANGVPCYRTSADAGPTELADLKDMMLAALAVKREA